MMKGKVIFELTNVGSKSQGEFPFLVVEDGKKIKLGFSGDNPFEQPTLRAYEGKEVVLEGEFNDNGKFIATSIQEILSENTAACQAKDCSDDEQKLCDEQDCCDVGTCRDEENCSCEEDCPEEENRSDEENPADEI